MSCFSRGILFLEGTPVSYPQLLPLPAHTCQHAQLAHNQQLDVYRLLVPYQMNIPVVSVVS